MANNKNLKTEENVNVTSIDELKKYVGGSVVELPPFAEGQRFFARLKRPSMLNLIKQGRIPNALLGKAQDLFENSGNALRDKRNQQEGDAIKQVFEVIDILCEASFVEPKYSQLKEAGIELTDDQYMFIFNYTQNGVQALLPTV